MLVLANAITQEINRSYADYIEEIKVLLFMDEMICGKF